MSNTDGATNGSAVNGYNAAPSSRWVMMIFVCLSVFVVNGFIYTTFNLLLNTVSKELLWSGEQRALVATGIPTGMICFVFIAGIALDKFSAKKLLAVFQIIAAVLVLLRGVIADATIYFVIMFFFGACFAMLSPANTKVISLWFGQKDIALANGILTAASPLGQITGNLLTIPIMTLLGGWQRIFWLQGIILVVLGICLLVFGRDRKNIHAELSSTAIQSESDLGVWKNLKSVARIPQLWMYVLANACFLGMIYGGGSMGYVVLQVDPKWGLPAHMPGIVTSFNNFSSMCMYVLAPLLIGKFLAKNYERNYRVLSLFAGVISGVAMSLGWRSYSLFGICAAYLISGIMFGQIVPVPKVLMMKLPEVSGPRAGTALGLFLTVERIAQIFITWTIGLILAANPEQGGLTMSYLCLLYCVSPVLIFFAMLMDRSQAKKEANVTTA